MYEVKKEIEENEKADMKYPVIMDRSYFNKIQAESFMSLKTSHVPMEGIIKLE